jgi:hypothetical protein
MERAAEEARWREEAMERAAEEARWREEAMERAVEETRRREEAERAREETERAREEAERARESAEARATDETYQRLALEREVAELRATLGRRAPDAEESATPGQETNAREG